MGTQGFSNHNLKFSSYDGNIVINAFDSKGMRVLVNLPADGIRQLRDFLNQTLQSKVEAPLAMNDEDEKLMDQLLYVTTEFDNIYRQPNDVELAAALFDLWHDNKETFARAHTRLNQEEN